LHRKAAIVRSKKIVISILLAMMILSASCSFKPPRSVSRSFYYWKSVFAMDKADLVALNALQVDRLYIKFFDVVWDQGYNQPVPVSIIDFQSAPGAGLEVVPVVFITVDALERMPVEQAGGLAAKIFRKINFILARNRLSQVVEIQLDCDWTASTRIKYFTILAKIREQAARHKIKLSATIRLHQVKYANQTGVPPADSGMLMFYNFESPKRADIENSILDLRIGKKYMARLKSYPLKLDLSLPLFSWGVLFQDSRYQGLIGNLHAGDLQKDVRFRREAANHFKALTDCRIKNIRVMKNDQIRVEESRFDELLASTRYLAGRIQGTRLHMAFFHWDRNLVEGVGGREKMVQLYDSLR
jgi:hypothetical protein